MKLSSNISYLIGSLGVREAITVFKAAGFDACDYGFNEEFDHNKLLEDDYAGYYADIKRLLDELGLECNQAHAPYVLEFGESYSTDTKSYLMLVRAIECAAILGAENIIVHPLQTPKDDDEHEVNLDFFKTLAPYAEKAGIHIAIENCYNDDFKRKRHLGRIGTPAKMNRLLDELDSDVFVMCLDIGHAAITGTEPEDYIRGMSSKRLKALHVHDTDYLGDTHTIPYLGKHNWDEICKALGEIGYDGAFTYEDLTFMRSFEPELLGDVMTFEAKIGRSLINKIEKSKKEN